MIDLDDDNDGILDAVECPVLDSGIDGPIPASGISFQIDSANPNSNSVPHTLNSITINGVVSPHTIFPDRYESAFSVSNNNIYERELGVRKAKHNDVPFTWDVDILPAFQSSVLNHYQGIDAHIPVGDYYDLFYDAPVIVSSTSYIAVTERFLNNPFDVQAFDINGVALGMPQLVPISGYVNTNHRTDFTQPIGIAVLPLDDLAPVGSAVASIRVFPISPGGDAGDGKVMLFGLAPDQFDTDSDGIPDCLDLDSNNDGISDMRSGGASNAALAADTNNNGLLDPGEGVDANGDGLIDIYGAGSVPADSDGDSVPDHLDLDSDNDGIPNVVEFQNTNGYMTAGC